MLNIFKRNTHRYFRCTLKPKIVHIRPVLIKIARFLSYFSFSVLPLNITASIPTRKISSKTIISQIRTNINCGLNSKF